MGCNCGRGSGNKVRINHPGTPCPKCGSPMRSVHKLDPATRRLAKLLVCANPKCGHRQ